MRQPAHGATSRLRLVMTWTRLRQVFWRQLNALTLGPRAADVSERVGHVGVGGVGGVAGETARHVAVEQRRLSFEVAVRAAIPASESAAVIRLAV